MNEGDFITECNIDLKYPKWDISVLGGLKSTHRVLLKIIHAEYEINQDVQIVLFYKRGLDNTEESIPYTLSKDENYFKQKLPIGILVREWRLQMIGVGLETANLIELGVNWIAHPIGQR